MDYKDYNDNELLMYISENNEQASEIMYKKYYPIIYDCAVKLHEVSKKFGVEFNDLIQEGMIGLSSAINHFDTQSETRFYTFACTCIKRKMISYVVKSGNKGNLILNESVSFECELDEKYKKEYIFTDKKYVPSDIVENRMMTSVILKSLSGQLSKYERQVLTLKIKGYTYNEISRLLNKSYKNIDNTIQRIRIKLKDIMQRID